MFKKKEAVQREEFPPFKIEIQPQITIFPDTLKDKTNVQYALIPPYAYANIFWDSSNKELIYYLQEPELNEDEQKTFSILEEGIKELTNISYIAVKKGETVIEYLEKNVKVLIQELKLKVSSESYLKIMYYIYRNFVGLNEIEPLMWDYHIEDVECNGIDVPIYVVHRKYRNLKTNIMFRDAKKLTSFVEKLAQKTGHYISYADPLLDASLPDGSRCNATFTEDISSRGPSFTIRKFTKIPWSPTRLMQFGTISPQMLAYLWILIEYEMNIMIIGGTSSGKTTLLNGLTSFIPPQARVVSIEDTRELALQHENWLPSVAREGVGLSNLVGQKYGEVSLFTLLKESFRQNPDYVIVGEIRGSIQGDEEIFIVDKGITKRIPIKNLEFMDLSNVKVPTLGKDLKLKLLKINKFIKHYTRDKLVEIKTRTGRRIVASLDHSLFTSSGCTICPIETRDLKIGHQIVIPDKIPYGYNNLRYLDLIKIYPDLRLDNVQLVVKECISKIGQEKANKLLDVSIARQYCRRSVTTNIPIKKFEILVKSAKYRFNFNNINLKVTNGNGKHIPSKIWINDDFCRLLGYYISEGSLLRRGVVISNKNPIIIKDVISISKKLFNITPKIRKNKGWGECYQIILSNAIVKRVIKDLCGETINKRVPSLIYGLSKDKICAFLRGAFSGDGSFNNNEVDFSSKLKKLAEDISYLLLSLNIVSRISKKRENLYKVRFKRIEDVKRFLDEVGFVQKKPEVIQKGPTHTSANSVKFNQSDLDALNLPRKYRHLRRFKRCSKFYLKKITNKISQNSYINSFADGDFFLDEIKSIKDLKSNDNFVYDISVDSTQNFIGGFGGIVLHNSEAYVLFQGMASVDGNEKIFILNDEHIKRIKIKNLEGKNLSRIKALVIDPETNEVKSLPIKSFIKHPPRKILYKIKTESGKEVKTTPDHSVFTYTDKIIPKEVKDLKIGDVIASVNVKDKIENSKLTGEKITEIKKITLKKPKDVYDISIPGYRNFVNSDGILLHNSGHPSFGTMHANSVDTMIKRLETPPINLSASLVETLDVVCVMIQTKVGGKLVRRISEVVEVIEVKEN